MANSILQGVISQPVDLAGAFSRGQQMYNSNQNAQLDQQRAKQDISEVDYQKNFRKLQIANRLAKQAIGLPQEARSKLMQDYSGALMSVGFTQEDLANTPLDDAGLQNLIAQTDSVIQASGKGNENDVQQAQYVEGLGYVQQLRNGQVTMAELSPEQQAKVKQALNAQAGRQAQAYGQKTAAGLDQHLAYDPTIKRSVMEAEQDVKLGTEPQIEFEVSKARQLATDEAKKITKQQGQMSKIGDASRIYKSLGDSDLEMIYGKGEKWYPEVLRSQKGVDMIAQRDQLIGMLNLAARGELAGQGSITESEGATVIAAATTLGNPNISPKEAREALDLAMSKIYGGAGEKFSPDKQSQGGSNIAPNIHTSKSGIKFEVSE